MLHFYTTVALLGLVIVVASLLSGALERSGLPLVAAFLGLGALLGPAGLGVADFDLGSPTLQVLAILGLTLVLFSDAVTVDTKEVRTRFALVWRMLGPGTLLPAIIIAIAARLLLHLSVPAAAILGAALASTDPVLLRTVLRAKELPESARVALRLESGMNDVVLVPIVVLSMLLLRPEGGPAPREVARTVVGLFLLGPVLGGVIGWLGITVLVHVRERFGVRRDYESLYALGLAFSAFAAAEAVDGSGFLAAFAAGLVVSAQDVELCDCFLEYGEATAEMLLLLTFVAFGTSLIWTGFLVADGPTLLFALIALVARTVVLYPMLGAAGVRGRDRRLTAFFGPRGLSSLLLALLPVFAGIPGAESLIRVTCLVALLSLVVHGGLIGLFLRGNAPPRETIRLTRPAHRELPTVQPAATPAPRDDASARITVDEVQELQQRGEPVIIVDSRAERSYAQDDLQAAGAVRVPPDDPVRAATALRLSQHATLVVYCA